MLSVLAFAPIVQRSERRIGAKTGLGRADMVQYIPNLCQKPRALRHNQAAEQRRDLLEIVDDRHGRASTIVTSQVPVERWHDVIGDPTLADAILDRLIHNAHHLVLKGKSMRPMTPARPASVE